MITKADSMIFSKRRVLADSRHSQSRASMKAVVVHWTGIKYPVAEASVLSGDKHIGTYLGDVSSSLSQLIFPQESREPSNAVVVFRSRDCESTQQYS
jgi:hypothetical protein